MSPQPRMSAAAFRRGAGRPHEGATHVPLYGWLRQHVTSLVWHTRNEGERHAIGRFQDAALGLTSGVPDLLFLPDAGPLFGRLVGIECKREGATESDVEDSQRAFGRALVDRGGLWTWVSTAEQGKTWCRANGLVRPAGWRPPWRDEPQEFAL